MLRGRDQCFLCGYHRTTFSPSIMWVLGMEIGSLELLAKYFMFTATSSVLMLFFIYRIFIFLYFLWMFICYMENSLISFVNTFLLSSSNSFVINSINLFFYNIYSVNPNTWLTSLFYLKQFSPYACVVCPCVYTCIFKMGTHLFTGLGRGQHWVTTSSTLHIIVSFLKFITTNNSPD